jgi:hypothetical protein
MRARWRATRSACARLGSVAGRDESAAQGLFKSSIVVSSRGNPVPQLALTQRGSAGREPQFFTALSPGCFFPIDG